MRLFEYFRASRQRNTASVAKERLQIIVAHERHQRNQATLDYLPLLQKEILEVVRKYVPISEEQIKINLEKEGDYEILELNITLPDTEGRQRDND
ncbi:MAG: cell division topological specificity factor MinE [Pseudomonadota bacterium]|nr:cell division topological specificity factor MinE [Pseudomonadota bacterium]